LQKSQQSSLAESVFEEVVDLAEPEGFMGSFIEKGRALEVLLYQLANKSNPGNYVHKIRTVWEKAFLPEIDQHRQGMIETLTPKECEVLQFLATNLSIPEIADQMIVSPNTVRTHVKHIYEKLGVNRRRRAVQKAKELKLV
jgi:LuxR family maltose regulon positive regulatory protein